jgi:hypothetical protein
MKPQQYAFDFLDADVKAESERPNPPAPAPTLERTSSTGILQWEHRGSEASACIAPEFYVDGIIYTVSPAPNTRKGRPKFIVDLLTDLGHRCIGDQFRTMEGAQRFCEAHLRRWRDG